VLQAGNPVYAVAQAKEKRLIQLVFGRLQAE
jgi:hypothetical protein